MKAKSIDIRERVVTSKEIDGSSIAEVAEEYEVSPTFVKKIIKQYRKLGHVEPLGHGGGKPAKLNPNQIKFVERQVKKHPDWTLTEHCAKVEQRYGISISNPTMCRILQKLELTRKKKPNSQRKK